MLCLSLSKSSSFSFSFSFFIWVKSSVRKKVVKIERERGRAKMMHMTFYWSREVTLLVDSWKTTSWTSYAFTILACFLASAFYQFMEDCRVRLKLASSSPSSAAYAAAPEAPLETTLLGSKASSAAAGGKKGWTVARVGGSVLFGVNAAIGYLLMLAVMSFNGGVFLSVVCGLGVGYLVFRSGTDDAVTATATAAADNACACA